MAKRTVTYYVDVDSSGAVKGWRKAGDEQDKFDNQTQKTAKALLSLDNVAKIAAAGGVGMVLQKAVTRSIQKGKEFESQLASLESITGITGSQLDRLGKQSLELSKIYGTSASNIIEANKLVASQLAEKIDFGTEEGFQTLQKVSEQAVVLAKAAGIELADAVNTTTSIINQFNLEASESERIINTLAAGSKYGAAEVPAIGRALVNAGSAAAGANQSIEMTNAAIQVLAANGQVGERAGTALRAIFLRLQTSGEALAKEGIENVDIKANGLVKTLQQLEPMLEDTAAMKRIFGEEAINAAQILIQQAESVESLTEKVTGTGVAYEQAEVNMDTFDEASKRLEETWNAALIPAFQESNGVMVKLINNVASLIENFAGGIAVINDWMDMHSELRKELGLSEAGTDAQVQSMQALREELALAAADGKITIDQQKELAKAYEATNEHLKKHASSLFDSTYAKKEERKRLNELIEGLKENADLLDYLPGPAESAYEKIERLTSEVEKLDLEIASGEERLKQYEKALIEGSISFEEFTQKVKESNEALNGDTSGGSDKERLNNLRTLAGLQAEIAAEKKKFEEASDQQSRDNHNARMQELQVMIDAIVQRYNTEETNLTSIAGVKAAISQEEQAFLKASSQAEREKHAQTMTELQEILQGMQIRSSSLQSIRGIQVAIREEEKSFSEATTDADRKRHADNIERLSILQQAKIEGLTEEEMIKKLHHEATIERMAEVMMFGGQLLNGFAQLSAAIHRKNMAQIQAEQKEMSQYYDEKLANENLTESERQRLISEREAKESALEKKLAESKEKAAKAEKKWALSQIVIQTAIAVMEAAPNPFKIAGAIALGGVQAAAVAAEPVPEFATGGMIGGRRHSAGGTMIEAEQGEYIINRESTRRALPLLQAINLDPNFIDRIMMNVPKFETGGLIPPSAFNMDLPSGLKTGIRDEIIAAINEGFENLSVRTVREGRDLVDYIEREQSRKNRDTYTPNLNG